MTPPHLSTLEDLHRLTGSTYRTIKGRLAEHGIEPVKRTKKSAIYETRPALEAIAGNELWYQVMLTHEKVWIEQMLPLLSDQIVFHLAEHLHEEAGLSKPDALNNAFMITIPLSSEMRRFFFRDTAGTFDMGGRIFEAVMRHKTAKTLGERWEQLGSLSDAIAE